MKYLTKYLICITVILSCYSCDSKDGSSVGDTGDTSETGGSGEVPGLVEIDVTSDDVVPFDVESYFSLLRYGATQKIYNIRNQNVVVIIRIDNQSTDFDTSIFVYLFRDDVEEGEIGNWINNQYSDALYPDVPEPASMYKLIEQSYAIASFKFLNHTVEEFGDEYDNYAVQIRVDDVIEEGVYKLKGFLADATVHVQTKGVDE